jgi:hypothetical protein
MTETGSEPKRPQAERRRHVLWIYAREALKLGAGTLAGAAASVAALQGVPVSALAAAQSDLNEASVAQLQALIAEKKLRSVDLVDFWPGRLTWSTATASSLAPRHTRRSRATRSSTSRWG